MRILAAALLAAGMGGPAMALEKRAYEVLEEEGAFSLRELAPVVVAETVVEGEFGDVGGEAFRRLAAYIGGANRARAEISMTAPVTQEPEASQQIAMTAPVTQERMAGEAGAAYRITFTMPSEYTLETLPEPTDPRVTLREEPGGRYAAVRYAGFWSRGRYQEELAALEEWMGRQGLRAAGEPVWARYDPPFMPWFLRRNEIWIPVAPR